MGSRLPWVRASSFSGTQRVIGLVKPVADKLFGRATCTTGLLLPEGLRRQRLSQNYPVLLQYHFLAIWDQ
jgi:hypothetical protein